MKGNINSSTTEAIRLSNHSERYSCEQEVPEKKWGSNHVSASTVDILKSIFLLRVVHTTSVTEIV